MKILVINPGATSTKICVFEDEEEVMRVGIDHAASEIAKYPHVVDQAPFRKTAILETIENDEFVKNLQKHAVNPYTKWWLMQRPDYFFENKDSKDNRAEGEVNG